MDRDGYARSSHIRELSHVTCPEGARIPLLVAPILTYKPAAGGSETSDTPRWHSRRAVSLMCPESRRPTPDSWAPSATNMRSRSTPSSPEMSVEADDLAARLADVDVVAADLIDGNDQVRDDRAVIVGQCGETLR